MLSPLASVDLIALFPGVGMWLDPSLVPRPSRMCEECLVFWATFHVTWGGADIRFEINQIAKDLIDVSDRILPFSQPVFGCPYRLCGRLELLQAGLCSSPYGQRHQRLEFQIEKCNYDILYKVQPHPMRQEMSLRTPDPLSAFRGRSGNKTARSILKIMLIHGIQPLMMSWLPQGWNCAF